MLFVNIGIMFSAYVGVRVFEHYRGKPLINKMALQPLTEPQVSHPEKEVDRKNFNQKTLKHAPKEIVDHEIEKYHDHYFKVSSIGMGLAATSYIYPPLTILSIGVIGYTVFPIVRQTENSLLKERRINNELVTSIVNIMTLAMGQYFACALQSWVYHLGDKMVTKSKDVSTQMLTNVFDRQPSKVWVLKDLMEIEISLEALRINDIVVVRTGEVIPIDGIITEGMARVDQHALTGESVPAEKGIGDKAFAATIIISGRICIKVEKTGLETTVAKLSEILNHTADFKTSLQLKGEKLSDQVAAPLLSLGLLSLPILGASSATVILFSAPTNTIKIFPSLQTFNHLTLVSNKGILIKDGRALEELTKIDTILFDKTGTLTKGEPKIGQIILCSDEGENEILTYAASAERRLMHPIARAIMKKAEEQHLKLPEIEEANYKIGYGVTVNFNHQVIKVGSARFMTLEGIALPQKIEEAKARSQEEGVSLVMVAVNHQIKGAIEIQPQVRPEVKQIISQLRQHGIQQISIVSGDSKPPTKKLAATLGMDNYFYEVLPQDKAALVEKLQKAGRRVCFVGDGINDAIAMKKANVSISLRGATSIATDVAQVVLMDGSLSHLYDIFDISTKLNTRLQHSLLFWAGYGIINLTTALLLPKAGVLTSTLFYGTAFGIGMGHAMYPLRQLEHKKDEGKNSKARIKQV
jgi:Cu2+-exporting ATPase